MRTRWIAALAALGLLSGCASAPIKKADLPVLDTADADVLRGCYACLKRARDTYQRVAVGKARPLVVVRLFQSEVLLALRERELALDASASFTRARALVPDLPPTINGADVLTMAESVPADDYGRPTAETQAFRRAMSSRLVQVDSFLEGLPSTGLNAPVQQYLAVAVDCAYPTRGPRAPGSPPRQSAVSKLPADAAPLVQYRAGICGRVDRARLERVRAAVPEFVETSYFIGRLAVSEVQQGGGTKARDLSAESYAAFPQSPSVTMMNGTFNRLTGDSRAALRFYDETLVLAPLHDKAMMGRVEALSYLKRHDEAIAAADDYINRRLDGLYYAYYWRAWNEHVLQRLPDARRDIEQAKAMASDGRIHTLAGIIEHDQDDLDPAERDLKIARSLSDGGRNCTAAWYLGLVYMKRRAWMDSGSTFEAAMSCYAESAADDERAIAAMEANVDLDPEFRTRQIASLRVVLKEDRGQQYSAALNASNFYATGGAYAKARPLLDMAAADPTLADKIAVLREFLKDK
jgi:tetratricopeptide (TPR) repeat protein